MKKFKFLLAVAVICCGFAHAKEGFDTIEIKEIKTIQKAILSLELSEAQRSKINSLEKTLENQIEAIKAEIKSRDESKLSNMYTDTSFKEQQFSKIYSEQMSRIVAKTSVYLDEVYRLLDKEQKKRLIRKIKLIEEE